MDCDKSLEVSNNRNYTLLSIKITSAYRQWFQEFDKFVCQLLSQLLTAGFRNLKVTEKWQFCKFCARMDERVYTELEFCSAVCWWIRTTHYWRLIVFQRKVH
jgi:hypothetical protein